MSAIHADPLAPPLLRRLASMLYEGILLFGVLVIAGYIFSVATQQRHALQGQRAMQFFVFALLGIYFTYFWARGGQTLAMKTWHIRIVGPDGEPPGFARCAARYLLAWLWFLPALMATQAFAGLSLRQDGLVLAGWMVLYAALSKVTPGRQFLHDYVCSTRLLSTATPLPEPKAHPTKPTS